MDEQDREVPELYTRENLRIIFDHSHDSPETQNPDEKQVLEDVLRVAGKYGDEIFDLYYRILRDVTDIVDTRLEKGDALALQQGSRQLSTTLLANLLNYLSKSAEIILLEGRHLYLGLCHSCSSETCPIIQRIKPNQYDEEKAREKQEQRKKRRASGIDIQIKGSRNPAEAIRSSLWKWMQRMIGPREAFKDRDYRDLSEFLGVPEEELREYVEKQVQKPGEDEDEDEREEELDE